MSETPAKFPVDREPMHTEGFEEMMPVSTHRTVVLSLNTDRDNLRFMLNQTIRQNEALTKLVRKLEAQLSGVRL